MGSLVLTFARLIIETKDEKDLMMRLQDINEIRFWSLSRTGFYSDKFKIYIVVVG